MAEIKTKVTGASIDEFLGKIPDPVKREDSYRIIEIMKQVTKEKPKMWGTSIIGFGKYHYKYESGHEGDMCMAGFSPRKQNLTIYLVSGFEKNNKLLTKLGKHKTSVSCLYIKKLEDVDIKVLKELIKESYTQMKKKYGRA